MFRENNFENNDNQDKEELQNIEKTAQEAQKPNEKEETKEKEEKNTEQTEQRETQRESLSLANKLDEISKPYFQKLQEKLRKTLKETLYTGKSYPRLNEELSHPAMKIFPSRKDQQKVWLEKWGKLVLATARKAQKVVFDVQTLLTYQPFQGVKVKALRKVITWLTQEGYARWLTDAHNTAVIFVETKQLFVQKLYSQARALGVPVFSLHDLHEIYPLPREDIADIVHLLQDKYNVSIKKNTIVFT